MNIYTVGKPVSVPYEILFNQLEPAFQRHNGHKTMGERIKIAEYGSCTDCTNCDQKCHLFPNEQSPEYSWRFRKNQRYLTRVEREIPELNEREAETNSIL
jgi:hypothetical protein